MTDKNGKYEENFKKSIVTMHQEGRSQASLCAEYNVSASAMSKWVKQYSQVKLDDNTTITAKEFKALQKRNAMLEEENIILKKAIAIFTPHSNRS